MADRLASSGMNFAAVYSSDLRRAAETAQAIADRCQCSKVSSYLHWNAVILIQALGIGLKGLGGKWRWISPDENWPILMLFADCSGLWHILATLMQVVLKEALRERNLGCLQGLTRAEARMQEPKAYKAFVSSDETHDIPVWPHFPMDSSIA